MIQTFSLIIKAIKDGWNNHKSSKSINQERYNLKGYTEIPENKIQNCCKSSCSDYQIKEPKKVNYG